ncbi:MAG: TlyA family rRNA (cytidine-2'-O)-methyltransferase [Anaerolineae bacterium]
MATKERLDVLLFNRGLVKSRELAHSLVMEGLVSVNGQVVSKPGTKIALDATLEVRALPKFVSRGGEKLAAALNAFTIPTEGAICADVGASTGGFTDCLLQHGAARVYAIDVGYGQLDYKLQHDPRVVVMDRTNVRAVHELPDPVRVVVIDASFISLKLILPVVREWLVPDSHIIPLIKPQFEAGRQDVGKGGVVKSSEIHARVLREVFSASVGLGLVASGLICSPLRGAAGNVEFLAWLRHNPPEISDFGLEAAIQAALPKDSDEH